MGLDAAALIIVDLQRAFCHPLGSLARSGLDYRAAAGVVAPAIRLVKAARAAGRPVVFTHYVLTPDWRDAGLLAEMSPALRRVNGLVRGTPDVELMPGLDPRPDEYVVDKQRYSAFWDTDLRARLSRHAIDTVVVCGVTTNVCVAATARDAFACDLRVVVVADATADVDDELHAGALRSIAYGIGAVIQTGAVVAQLQRVAAEAATQTRGNPMSDGAIDIVCLPHTPREVAEGQVGVDEQFMDKVRMPADLRRGVTMEDYVTKMDRAGVERSLLVAPRCGDPRIAHSYSVPYERIAEHCARFPGRFSGVAGIDPSRIVEGVHEFEQAVAGLGFVAAHLYPHWYEAAPDDRRYYPFYAKCCELRVPIMMQIGHCLDYQRDRVLPSVGRPVALDRVAIDFPELTIIGIHLGWPWTEEMIAMCFKHQNVFMAGDAYAPKHWPAEYVHYCNSWGQDKVLFGTDWPVIDPERAMAEVHDLGLRPEPKRKLLRDNALRLFDLR